MIMKAKEFAEKAVQIANKYKTIYAMGAWGTCMHDKGKARVLKNTYNQQPERKAIIEKADGNTFAFDCVGLIKTILWGWCGSTNKTYSYGGASALSNGVPDVGADNMIKLCYNESKDFNAITIGEMVWMPGHCGIYIGNQMVAEATPKWYDGVQISTFSAESEMPYRKWESHGQLPWIDYTANVGDNVRIVVDSNSELTLIADVNGVKIIG